MPPQSEAWSRAATNYEEDFIDPYRDDVRNPLLPALKEIAKTNVNVVADLGCGMGPLLPFLAARFAAVYAVDFAEGMLARAKKRCRKIGNITYIQQELTDLSELEDQLDVAVAINSLVMPDIRELELALSCIQRCLRPGGTFLAILPAMDAIHYETMLRVDRALALGMPIDAARKNAAQSGEHEFYDFAFGQFNYKGLRQHFWQPFEIDYRFERAGFSNLQIAKVDLSWQQIPGGEKLGGHEPPWDWFVQADRAR